jgi:hypothetical protein
MITLQRSNPTVTQILAAHGCQTTALQDRYDIHTACSSSCSSFAFPLGLLRLSHIAPNNDNHTDTSLRGGGDVPVCVRRRRLSHSGTELVCLAQCISGVCVVPVMAPEIWCGVVVVWWQLAGLTTDCVAVCVCVCACVCVAGAVAAAVVALCAPSPPPS